MRWVNAAYTSHGLKAALHVVLSIVLVVSLCPSMSIAFAGESDTAGQTADSATVEASGSGSAGDASANDVAGDGDSTASENELSSEKTAGEATSSENGESNDLDAQVASGEKELVDGAEAEVADGAENGDDASGSSQDGVNEDDQLDADGDADKLEGEAKPTLLEAKAEGVHATLSVDASAALPEGVTLVVTPLISHDEETEEVDGRLESEDLEGVADDEEASVGDGMAVVAQEQVENEDGAEEGISEDANNDEGVNEDGDNVVGVSEEGDSEDASDGVAEGESEEAGTEKDSESAKTVTGADVALTGMASAVKSAIERDGGEVSDALTITDAYAVEVVDADGSLVSVPKDQAKLRLTIEATEEEQPQGDVYAVEREGASESDDEQEAAAKEQPVTNVAETEYADADEAGKEIAYEATAEDVTNEAQADDEGITVEVEGAQSVAVADSSEKAASGAQELAIPALGSRLLAAGPLRAPSKPGTIETVDTAALGITMNLFDYEVPDTLDNSFDDDPGKGVSNSGINSDKDKSNQLKFYGTGDGKSIVMGTQTGSFSNPGNGINQFTGGVGEWPNSFYTLQVANQGIVQSSLGSDEYPVLNTSSQDSLSYLFNPEHVTNGKTTYKNVNHLFKLENAGTASERMVYDSNQNYAYYCNKGDSKDNGDFTVYNGTYERSGGSKSHMMYGFFPFNDWGTASDCINPNEDDWSSDNHPDHHLGLTMTTPLTMPYNGQITKNGQSEDMVFEFSGDDDMWVFVDGKLVLDIGGIHQPVSGSINFNSGAIVLGRGTANLPVDKNGNSYSQEKYSYAAAGITNTTVLGDSANLWDIIGAKDSAANRAGTTHTLQVFYLERGGCDSNLKISTNIHLMTKKKVSVEKQWDSATSADNPSSVKVQLVRKATAREDASNVSYGAVGNPVELNSGNSWAKNWVDLPSEGYNADATFHEGGNNVYCDYEYMVVEVPIDGYEPLYSDNTAETLVVQEVTYGGASHEAVAVDTTKLPVTITNVGTYIDVEKQWKNAAGTSPDSANHDDDSVWVQLYKQTRTNAEAEWGAETAVGDPVELKKSNDWKHRFNITETGANVRYCVKEGVKSGDVFTPKDDLTAAGKTYRWFETEYTTHEPSGVANGSATWKDAVKASSTGSQNNYVTVPKAGHAEAVIKNKPVINLELIKVDATDSTSKLTGAMFDVYKDDGDGECDVTKDTKTTSVTTGDAGSVKIEDVTPGKTYWLVEVEAPAGYVVRENPVKVVVKADGTIEVSSEGDVEAMEPSIDGTSITIPDLRTYNLPSTGGPGVLAYLFVGAFLMTLTSGVVITRRKEPVGHRGAHAAHAHPRR